MALLRRFLKKPFGSKPTLSRVKAHTFSGENPQVDTKKWLG